MIGIKKEGIVLTPGGHDYEAKGVLNPACIEIDGIVHMFYRAIGSDDVSTIGYCQLRENKVIFRSPKPLLAPEFDYESKGLEDPRITFLDGIYYLFYTVYDGKSALAAYATTDILPNFKKRGLVTPNISYSTAIEMIKKLSMSLKYELFASHYEESRGKDVLLWDKDVILFPQKFNGRFGLIHRILPEIQIIYFNRFTDLTEDFWKKYLMDLDKHILLRAENWFETQNIGGGCPPIRTRYGWLMIYHAVEASSRGRIYHAGAALLDLEDPTKTISRLPEPLFSPSSSYEQNGIVNNVVFPTAALIVGTSLNIYYGAADKVIAMKSINLESLLSALMTCAVSASSNIAAEPQFDSANSIRVKF